MPLGPPGAQPCCPCIFRFSFTAAANSLSGVENRQPNLEV